EQLAEAGCQRLACLLEGCEQFAEHARGSLFQRSLRPQPRVAVVAARRPRKAAGRGGWWRTTPTSAAIAKTPCVMSICGSVGSGFRRRRLRLLLLLEVDAHAVEDAVDEPARVRGGEAFPELDGLVDGHLRRDVVAVPELEDRHPEHVSVHCCHPLQVPIAR